MGAVKVIFQLESPESLEGLAHFMTFVRGSKAAFEKKMKHTIMVPIDWICRDYKGGEYDVREGVLTPRKAEKDLAK